jgi:hypothetical protein
MITTTPTFRVGDVAVTLTMDTDSETVTETYEVMGVLVTVTSVFPEGRDMAHWLCDRLSVAREAAGLTIAQILGEAE